MLPFEFHNLNKSACHSIVITQWNCKCLHPDGLVGICEQVGILFTKKKGESDTLWLCYIYYTGCIHGNAFFVLLLPPDQQAVNQIRVEISPP